MFTAFQINAFQNNAFQIGGEIVVDTHDGFTPEEVRKYKKWQKKQAKLEALKIQQRLDNRKRIRQAIQNAVEPPKVVAETQQIVVESAKLDKKAIDIKQIDAQLARIERQKAQLLEIVSLRNRLQAELVARQRAEEDDEIALLMLM